MQTLRNIRSVGAVIPLRTSASRLPGKPLRDVSGKSALERVASQASRCRYVSKVVIATTSESTDDALAAFAKEMGYAVYRGSVQDVLKRLAEAASTNGFDAIVEVDGDDLFCAHEYMDRGVEILDAEGLDLVTFTGLPIGATPNILRTAALVRAVELKKYDDTATGFFRFLLDSGAFRVKKIETTDPAHRHATVRMTLDYPQDLEFFVAAWREMDALGRPWTLADLVSMLNGKPAIVAINQGLEAVYAAHFQAGLADMRLSNGKKTMRFLQVGLGSMGKRRIRCLKALGETDVIAFDTREDRRAEAEKLYGVKTAGDFEQALAMPGIDAVLVSTPPDAHYPFVKAALRAGKHTFCEANIVTEGADELGSLGTTAKRVAAPSATMRFHPLYKHLKRLVVEEKVLGKALLMNYHLGNYILDWHPWEGLNFYAGKKSTGACREMVPFEFEWMTWIFGPVESVQCTYARLLDLPTDLDDSYAIIAKFQSGLVANVMVDVVARYPIRDGRLLSQKGNIDWSFDTGRLKHYDGETKVWRDYKAAGGGFNIEQMYVDEIEAWLKAVRGDASAWTHSYAHDRELGRILLACEKSSDTGTRVTVKEVAA